MQSEGSGIKDQDGITAELRDELRHKQGYIHTAFIRTRLNFKATFSQLATMYYYVDNSFLGPLGQQFRV